MFKNKLEEQQFAELETRFILSLDIEDAFKKEVNFIDPFARSTFNRWTNQLTDKIKNLGYDLKRISNMINAWVFKFDITEFNDTQNVINTFCNYKLNN